MTAVSGYRGALTVRRFTHALTLDRFQYRRDALSAADALRGKRIAAAGARQQRRGLAGDARARCAGRMAK